MAAAVRARVAWPHPEWWTLAMSAVAWTLIAAPRPPHHDHGVVAHTRDWLLMIVAMMLPLSVASIQATAARSLWRRRHRAIAWWLAGYLTPWFMLGAAVSFAWRPVSAPVAALAFIVAGLWQVSTLRARALKRCHRTPSLAPTGWRANYDCARYGWTTGVYCVAACGALMVACSLLGHGPIGLAGMVATTMVGAAERYLIRPDQRWLAGGLALQAVVAAVAV